MDNDTRQPSDRQDHNARLIAYGIGLLVALAFLLNRFAPAPTQPPPFYYPDPTPFVVETQRIEIFSNNRMCIGSFESC